MSIFVPGKVILVGEHAVVYGEPALATSLSMGVRVRVSSDGWRDSPQDKKGLIKRAVELAKGDETIGIELESELPVGAGLGSSAAVSAAVIRGVRQYLGNPIENDELFELTMICEREAHGNPSGIDPTTVIYGGLIEYMKGQPFKKLAIKQPLKIMLANTGKPSESTREMVEMVAEREDKDKIVNKIGELVLRVRDGLIEGRDVTMLLDQNGKLLEELGVVGERARELSGQLRGKGYAIKITGAGGVKTGSGMMLVVGADFGRAKKILDNIGVKYFETTVGGR